MATDKIDYPTQGDTIIFNKTAEDTDGKLLEVVMIIEPQPVALNGTYILKQWKHLKYLRER